MTEQEKPRILLNGSFAESLILFRGPLIAAMSARGYQVHVTAPAISAEIEHQLLALGAIVHDVPLARTGINPFHDYKYAKAIVKLIKIIRPIRVINYTIKSNILG